MNEGNLIACDAYNLTKLLDMFQNSILNGQSPTNLDYYLSLIYITIDGIDYLTIIQD